LFKIILQNAMLLTGEGDSVAAVLLLAVALRVLAWL
jgi:hypothetical protein